MSKSETNR